MRLRFGSNSSTANGSLTSNMPKSLIGQKADKDTHLKPRWCAAQIPYPEVIVPKPNLFFARLLREDHAGYVSETSAITQYLYHHQVLKEAYPDVAELLECIAVVEMKHMELLGEAIVKLGGQPKFGTETNQGTVWWSGDFIYYGRDICDMLAADIQGEIDAINQYQKHIKLIDDQNLRSLIGRIIKDEQEHIALINEKIDKYCRAK